MSTIKEINHLVSLLQKADEKRTYKLTASRYYGYKITTETESHDHTHSDTKKGCAEQARRLLKDIEIENRHTEDRLAMLDRIEMLELALSAALAAPAAPARRM